MTQSTGRAPRDGAVQLADTAGVTGAVLAALCCAGTPLIVGALGTAGLSFLRRDAVMWPVMLLSLTVALWGSWQGRRMHHGLGPLVSGVVGAASLASGVILVHGPPAMTMIYGGAIMLAVATLWNVRARRYCVTDAHGSHN